MLYTLKELVESINRLVSVNYPILIRGRHAKGKSEVVRQVAAGLGLDVVSRRASQMVEGDILGIPDVNSKEYVTYLPPEWLYDCCKHPRLLFLDEIDRGTHDVRQAIFELCDSRCVAGQHLHPDTRIFAAINGGVYGADYDVYEMGVAELSRWTVYDFEPDVDEWLKYCEVSDVPQIITEFIGAHPEFLEHDSKFTKGTVYPDRRKWFRFAELYKTGCYDELSGDLLLEALNNDLNAFCGEEAAAHFSDYALRKKSQIIDYKIFLVERQWDKLFGLQKSDYSAMIDSILGDGVLSNYMTESDWEAFATIFQDCDGDNLIKLFRGLSKQMVKNKGVASVNFSGIYENCWIAGVSLLEMTYKALK